MFDNEIDWVTRLERLLATVRREAAGSERAEIPSTYTYKAEHKQWVRAS